MSIVLDGTTGITTPGLTNTGTETIVNLTTTGNTILGDASTDTLNVGNGGLVKDASGNVGIGTASPATKLHLYGAVDQRIRFENTGWTKAYQIGNDQTALSFYDVTAAAERMRIDSSGVLTTYGVTTASGASIAALNGNSTNTTVNSSTYNVTFAGSAKVFWVSLASGDGCLVVTNYLTTTITIVGTGGNIVASASPTASQLGISKSVNSHVVTFKTGSAAATQFGSWSVGSLSSSVS